MRYRYDPLIHTLTFLYGLIPIAIFFLGWLRPMVAIPATLLLIYSAVVYTKRIEKAPALTPQPIDWRRTSLIAIMAFVWVYCSGIGGYTNQDWDHHGRNAIFHDLITFDWPIYYDFPVDYHFRELAGKHSSLNYYFTFWLPAACIGKVFGYPVASAFLVLWTYIGILLSFYYLNRLFSFNYALVCVGLFILWSGFDLFGYLLIRRSLPPIDALSETYYYYFYTSFTADLYNPFNQAVPAWLLTLYILNDAKKLQVLPLVILFAYSPFCFVGLVLAHGLYYLLATYRAGKTVQDYGQEIFQALWRPDTLGVLVILISYALFYQAHSGAVQNTVFWARYLTRGPVLNTLLVGSYVVTFFLEVGVYLAFIYFFAKSTYRAYRLWFWLIFVVLFLLPLWVIGTWNDLASRGSIPFLTVLLIMTLTALIEFYEKQGRRTQFYGVLCVLVLSFQTPIYSLIRSLSFTDKPILLNAVGSLADPQLDENNDPAHMLSSVNNFYSHDPKQFLFYRYLAKR
ncbi:hypothetical protein [Spirosoma koreense]